jgi:hypothetical protein
MGRCGSAKRRMREFRKKSFRNVGFVNCHYCDEPITFNQSTADHVEAMTRGGRTVESNLVISCLPCNLQKGCLIKFPDILLGKEYAKLLIASNVEVQSIGSGANAIFVIQKNETRLCNPNCKML